MEIGNNVDEVLGIRDLIGEVLAIEEGEGEVVEIGEVGNTSEVLWIGSIFSDRVRQ